ncbi:MAG: phenylalanine--tRNA ligase subunit beta, partial [bacterium]|nr:phenylalanine--tRNA ligase subunit beta [bacterium]
ESAANRAAFLIQKLTKGKVAQGLVDVYPKKLLSKIIRLDLDYVERLLGTEMSENEVRTILGRFDFKVKSQKSKVKTKSQKSKVLEVEVPTRRLDVSTPEDLIEEIGRIHGYDKIPSAFPISSLVLPQKNLNIFWEDMTKNILKEAGFTEVYNYSFFGEKEATLFGYRAKRGEEQLTEVENPLNQEYKYLRASLIPNLLKNTEKNFRHFKKFRVFELGKIFEAPSTERRQLSGLILGEEFYHLKGVIDLLLNKLGISDIWYDEYQPTPEDSKQFIWHPKKCAEIKIGSQEIGFLGEVSSKILSNLAIKERVVLFDIDFEKLSQLASEEHEYRPISKFPSAVRDIAVLVPRNVRIDQVLNKIYDAGRKTIRDVDLFDIYEGEEIAEGKKNLAFHIIYQAEDRTLSSKEIDELQNKIIKNLEEEPEWQVRK